MEGKKEGGRGRKKKEEEKVERRNNFISQNNTTIICNVPSYFLFHFIIFYSLGLYFQSFGL